MRRTTTAIISGLLLVAASFPGTLYALTITNSTPAKNPCDPGTVISNKMYDEFRAALEKFLKSPVIADIDRQVKNKSGKDPDKVTVEIAVVNEETFIKTYQEDTDGLGEEKPKNPKELFRDYAAWTYTTDTLVGDVQKIKVVFFCKRSLHLTTAKNTDPDYELFRQMIHEFVHAKLYSALVLGVDEKEMFQDHDDDFKKEEEKLFEVFKSALLGSAPRMGAAAENVLIADLGVGDQRLLPSSGLYFLKDIARGVQKLLTFTPVKKAALELRFSDEKLAEAAKVAEVHPDNTGALERAIENYRTAQEALAARFAALSGTSEDPKIDALLLKFADHAVKHELVFAALSAKAEGEGAVEEKIEAATAALETSVGEGAKKDREEAFANKLKRAFSENRVGEADENGALAGLVERLVVKTEQAFTDKVKVSDAIPPACDAEEAEIRDLAARFGRREIPTQEFLPKTELLQQELFACLRQERVPKNQWPEQSPCDSIRSKIQKLETEKEASMPWDSPEYKENKRKQDALRDELIECEKKLQSKPTPAKPAPPPLLRLPAIKPAESSWWPKGYRPTCEEIRQALRDLEHFRLQGYLANDAVAERMQEELKKQLEECLRDRWGAFIKDFEKNETNTEIFDSFGQRAPTSPGLSSDLTPERDALRENSLRPSDQTFKIVRVDGYTYPAARGDTWPLSIKVLEPDGTPGTPREGFAVQVYVFLPRVKAVFGGNGEFDGSFYRLKVPLPQEDGQYQLWVAAYCGMDESLCEQRYGRARQVEWTHDFLIGAQASVPAPVPKPAQKPPPQPPTPPPGEAVFCTQVYIPVCGVDGKTYSNRCAAEEQSRIKVAYEGECKKNYTPSTSPTPPPSETKADCGAIESKLKAILSTAPTDAQTLEKIAYLQKELALCASGSVPPPPEEYKAVCTDEYRPVCGLDGKTYQNSCQAKAAGVEGLQYEGECGKPIEPPPSDESGAPDADSSLDQSRAAFVTIDENGQFNPPITKIRRGGTVSWGHKIEKRVVWPASNDHPSHTIYPGFDALKGLAYGETYSFVFNIIGVWKYHDHLNPAVAGVVEVVE